MMQNPTLETSENIIIFSTESDNGSIVEYIATGLCGSGFDSPRDFLLKVMYPCVIKNKEKCILEPLPVPETLLLDIKIANGDLKLCSHDNYKILCEYMKHKNRILTKLKQRIPERFAIMKISDSFVSIAEIILTENMKTPYDTKIWVHWLINPVYISTEVEDVKILLPKQISYIVASWARVEEVTELEEANVEHSHLIDLYREARGENIDYSPELDMRCH